MPTSLKWRKAVSGTTAIAKGGPKSPESLARGMFPKGFPRNPGELAISPLTRAVTRSPRETRGGHGCGRAVLRTHSTDEGGEPQGSARSGHGTHWREGGNRCTYLAKGNIAEAQTSTHYVHTNRQNIRTSQGGSEATILFDRSSDHGPGVVCGFPRTQKESQRRSGRRHIPKV